MEQLVGEAGAKQGLVYILKNEHDILVYRFLHLDMCCSIVVVSCRVMALIISYFFFLSFLFSFFSSLIFSLLLGGGEGVPFPFIW